MGKSKAPKAPDPVQTAAAQTSSNIATAIANSSLGNVNQITPDGSLTYKQTGSQVWTDPLSGKTYNLPTYTAEQKLSAQQQAIKNQEDAASLNLATLAATQAGKLNSILGTSFNLSGLPARGDYAGIANPSYTQFGSGPQLQTEIGNYGDVQKSIGDAGQVVNSYQNDFSADRQRVEDALMSRLNPQMERDRAALEMRLANAGVMPGSAAYDRAIDELNRSASDARFGAILNAGQEQSRLAGLANQEASFRNAAQSQVFGQNQAQWQANNTAQQQMFDQGMAGVQFSNNALQQMHQNTNSAIGSNNALADQRFNTDMAKLNAQDQQRQQAMQEAYAARNQSINEITSLMSGSQVGMPNFMNIQGQQIANVDYAGLVQQNYQNQMAAYQSQQAQIGGIMGGLANLFTLSDRTAKKDIKKVGGLYEYRYKGEGKNAPKRIGVMAQEVEKAKPSAVRTGADGLKRVDYGALFAQRQKKK